MTLSIESLRAMLPGVALTLALAACGGGGGAGDGAAHTSSPPPRTYTVAVTVTSPMAGGERFVFRLDQQDATVTARGVAVAFGQALAAGSDYVVYQVGGPRVCTLSANERGVIAADVTVSADCGVPAG